MIRMVCVAVFAILFLPPLASAGSATVRGVGSVRCATWERNPEKRPAYMQWVLGFVSAMNYAHWRSAPRETENIDLLSGRDADAIQAWMTTFCAQNQLQPIGIAAAVLVNEGLAKTKSLESRED